MELKKKIISVIFTGALLLSFILPLIGCSKPTTPPQSPTPGGPTTTPQPTNTVLVKSADGACSIEVPAGWNTNDTTVSKLSANTAIAVSNDVEKQYLLVTKLSKAGLKGLTVTISNYFDAVQSAINGMLNNPSWSSTSNVTIGTLNGLMATVTGKNKVDGSGMVFFVYSLEGQNNFYSLIAYTTQDLEAVNQPILESVVNTFKGN